MAEMQFESSADTDSEKDADADGNAVAEVKPVVAVTDEFGAVAVNNASFRNTPCLTSCKNCAVIIHLS